MDEPKLEQLAKLREPFPASQIGKLPRKGGILLDFVGHGYLTARLLDVDPLWVWEPFAIGEDGLPKLDENGGLWIRLTVCGMTRIGYGDAGGREGPNAVKEAIGDALRNAAMRFGAALDLWCKGDLDAHTPVKSDADMARDELLEQGTRLGWKPEKLAQRFYDDYGKDIRTAEAGVIRGFTAVIISEAESQDAGATDDGSTDT